MAEPEGVSEMEEAINSLERIQTFKVEDLAREKDLGTKLSFKDAVEPARRLVELYKRLPTGVIEDLPKSLLKNLKAKADEDYNRFHSIMNFDPLSENATGQRDTLIKQVVNAYDPTFISLHPLISYSTSKSADFQRLEGEARAAVQSILDKGEELTETLKKQGEEGSKVLEEIREVAAEHGVTQQAIYFDQEASRHSDQANNWLIATGVMAVVLGAYAFLSLFMHKWARIAPANNYELAQVAISKILIFAVISYMLYLCARNFLSNRHNAIINRHRQNALMTYNALVEAAGNSPNRDVVLVHAAACIFSPQCTGFTKEEGGQTVGAKSVIEMLTQPLGQSTQ